MFKHKNLIYFILIFVILLGLGTSIFQISAAEADSTITNTDATVFTFSVIVPYNLPINVSEDGVITTATDTKIINNSNRDVYVSNLSIEAMNGWTIVDYETDLRNAFVDSQQISLMINDCKTTDDETITFNTSNFATMSAQNDGDTDECAITYAAKLSLCSESCSNVTVANIIFTIDWAPIIVPEGSTYYVGVTSTTLGDYTGATAVYQAGDAMPETVNNGDVFVYGDYEYRYNMYYGSNDTSSIPYIWRDDDTTQSGWGVRVLDDSKTSYGVIEESINGEPITTLRCTFHECKSLEIAPEIPSTVTNMQSAFHTCTALLEIPNIPEGVTNMRYTFRTCSSIKTYANSVDADYDFSNYVIPNTVETMEYTFYGCTLMVNAPAIPDSVTNINYIFRNCTALTTAPEIPSSVTTMNYAFYGCTSLTTTSTIPSSVTSMRYTFNGCTSLTGTIVINANPTSCVDCFLNTVEMIYLTGDSTVLEELAATDGYTDLSDNDNVRVEGL